MTIKDELEWRKSKFCESSGCVEIAWVKSTRSLETNACVEVARCANGCGDCVEVGVCGCGIAVRDSKNPDGPVLQFSRTEWEVFVAGVKAGDFD